jgi:outer membrane protein OmpA-like peptidoglycan-associated protein
MQARSVKPRVAAAALVQREPVGGADHGAPASASERLLARASPFLAASIGSTTLSGFDTGHAELKPAHVAQLRKTADCILVLLRQYPQSTVTVTGHTDTVGTEEHNRDLARARAEAAADALEASGVPAGIVTTLSAGEAGPQAVATPDETPDAKNRRAEVRFEPKVLPAAASAPKLASAESSDRQHAPPADLRYHPPADVPGHTPPDRRDEAPPGLWKPLPPMPKGAAPKSPLDVLGEKLIDPVVDRVAHGLSRHLRDLIKQKARDGMQAGVAKLARTAAERAGVTDGQALDAIEKATEAAIQQKGRPPP